jgi:hypothetical protein
MSRACFAVLVATLGACADDGVPLRLASAHLRTTPGTSDERPTEPAPVPSAPPAPVPDAGPPADAAPPLTAFTGTTPYALITPPAQSSDHHGGDSNAGKDCLLCHTGAGAPKFAVAGTVYTTKSATAGASGVQVRVVSPTGVELALVGTDADGNFWFENDATILPPGSRVGVRDTTSTQLMTTAPGASCNQTTCHVSTTRPIYLNE